MKTHLSRTILASLSAICLAVCVANVSAAKKNDTILAQVGKYKLTVKDFNDQIRSLPPQLQMALMRNPSLKEQLLDRWVQITLLAQEARAKGLDKRADVQKRIEDITNAVLAQEYMRREMGTTAKVTDAEAKKYYEAHKADFKEPEAVKARHILIKVPSGADKKTWEAARKKAEDIRNRLEKGADFSKLAKKYSDDPGTKNKGGELGFFPKGRMVPGFEKAAFSLKPGEISNPVKTTFGYHIIQVQEKRPASQKKFAAVEAQIRQKLMREKEKQYNDELMKRLKAKYKVTINKEALTKEIENSHHGSMAMPGHP